MCVCVTATSFPLCASPEGSRADDIAQAAEQLNQRWVGFCALLADRLAWLAYQAKVHTHTHTHVHPICKAGVLGYPSIRQPPTPDLFSCNIQGNIVSYQCA